MERRKIAILTLVGLLLCVIAYWVFFLSSTKKALQTSSKITRVPSSLETGKRVDHEIKQINVEYFKKQKELMESRGESYISKYQLESKSKPNAKVNEQSKIEDNWEYKPERASSHSNEVLAPSDPEFDKATAQSESQWGNYIESELQNIKYKNTGSGSKINYLNHTQEKELHETKISSTAGSQKSQSIRLSGDKDFGIIEGELNTDVKSPVLARILSGPLKGGKLVGEFQLDEDHVTIKFNKLSYRQISVAVNAVAIDPDKLQMGLADSVDRHLIGRYGSLFASSFLEGVFEAIRRNPVVYSTGNTNVQEASQLSRRDQFLQAAGKTGQAFTPFAKQYFNRPTTVKLNQGRGIGILYLDRVELGHG